MASTSTKPTFVLVPGAWHPAAASFELLTSRLQAAGYKTVPVELPSYGADPALQDFVPDVAAIRQAIQSCVDAGEEVVLFMHSYGGVVGTEACRGLDVSARKKEGKAGGIVRLVYCAAFLLQDLIEMLQGTLPPWCSLSDDGTHVHAQTPEEIFYNDLSPEVAAATAATLKCHSYRTFLSKLTYAAWRDIPVTYLLCDRDNAIPAAVQQLMIDGAQLPVDVERLDASHSPFLSLPDDVATACRRAAGEKANLKPTRTENHGLAPSTKRSDKTRPPARSPLLGLLRRRKPLTNAATHRVHPLFDATPGATPFDIDGRRILARPSIDLGELHAGYAFDHRCKIWLPFAVLVALDLDAMASCAVATRVLVLGLARMIVSALLGIVIVLGPSSKLAGRGDMKGGRNVWVRRLSSSEANRRDGARDYANFSGAFASHFNRHRLHGLYALNRTLPNGDVRRRPEPGAASTIHLERGERQSGTSVSVTTARGLQVIVEISSIELTPESPIASVCSWVSPETRNQKRDMAFEDRYRITKDRPMTDPDETTREPAVGNDDDIDKLPPRCRRTLLANTETPRQLSRGGAGSVFLSPAGGMVAFPSVMQCRILPFRLDDTTRPGNLRRMTLSLVDPHLRICSAQNMPPQQNSWWAEAAEQAMQSVVAAAAKAQGRVYHLSLSPEILDQIIKGTDDWPMGEEEARWHQNRRRDEVRQDKGLEKWDRDGHY